jgi:signal transduction histidine kinase
VRLTVSDEGIGISEEDVARLGTEFFRSSNPEAVAQPGTGLGLAIVSRVVARHHGRMEIESALGRGSTFRVFLPQG